MNLTDRDHTLLNLLVDKSYLRRDQIMWLLPNSFASTDVLNRRLRMLFQKHFVDKFYPKVPNGEGSSQQYVALDRASISYLGLGSNYTRAIRYDSNGERHLPADWRHHSKIIDVECDLIRLRKDLDYTLMGVQQERMRRFGMGKRLIPDLFAFIKRNNQGYVFFIEVDMGTEDVPTIKEKVTRYVEYYWSKEWHKEFYTQKFKDAPFPHIIFITTDKHQRIRAIQEHFNQTILQATVIPYQDLYNTLYSVLQS